MITSDVFLVGLLIISTTTGLVTEALKKLFEEHGVQYKSNTLAGIVAVILSIAVSIGYTIIADLTFTASLIIYMIALALTSWLCAMIGYDKVIQTIEQFTSSKDFTSIDETEEEM